RAQRRVLVHAGARVDRGYLGFGHFAREDTADATSPGVDVEHHLGGALQVHAEELLQHGHDEVHGGVVVVQQDHLVHRWRRDFRPAGIDQGAVFVIVAGVARHVRDYTFRRATRPQRRGGWTRPPRLPDNSPILPPGCPHERPSPPSHRAAGAGPAPVRRGRGPRPRGRAHARPARPRLRGGRGRRLPPGPRAGGRTLPGGHRAFAGGDLRQPPRA